MGDAKSLQGGTLRLEQGDVELARDDRIVIGVRQDHEAVAD